MTQSPQRVEGRTLRRDSVAVRWAGAKLLAKRAEGEVFLGVWGGGGSGFSLLGRRLWGGLVFAGEGEGPSYVSPPEQRGEGPRRRRSRRNG